MYSKVVQICSAIGLNWLENSQWVIELFQTMLWKLCIYKSVYCSYLLFTCEVLQKVQGKSEEVVKLLYIMKEFKHSYVRSI